jgi:hypothetical protein
LPPIFVTAPITISGWCYVVVWVATLLDQFAHVPAAGDVAGLAVLAFLVLEFPHQRGYAQMLFLALFGIGMAGAAAAADPLTLALSGLRRGAAYAAFFLALTTLRDAAETSPLVRRCGQHLVAQPPGRRYAALTGGGHVFGIILSYGAIDLLAAMVSRANRVGSDLVRAARARRMLMAINRGFCVMNCWSPLNIMTAVVSTAVPAAPRALLLPLALVISVLFMALGWLEDRMSAARRATAGGTPPTTTETWGIHLRITALVGLVMVLAEASSAGLGVSLVAAVTLCVPLVGMGWVLIQAHRFVARPGTAGRVLTILHRRGARFLVRVPSFRGEATVLASSGFMGVTVGGVLPTDSLAPLLVHLTPMIIPLLVPVLLIATGQLGLNPIAVVALLGAAMPDPARFGVPPAALAFACMLGWGLGVSMTPMSASAITTARWAGVSPWTICTRWNAVYTLSALLLGWVAIAGVFVVWP